ncbi:unnamed protein product [Rangifer tarandus platyrhynchus]|uniref:Uncharacterized protein n=1 Tax=Rangifer tarandus platyrhynchus TaxID=3082113 RepID=A0AC59ZYK2_RANTA
MQTAPGEEPTTCQWMVSWEDTRGFPGGSNGKESACNAGDRGSIPGLGGSPGGGHGDPPQCSRLENPRGQRRLAGYSPWGHRVGHHRVSKHTWPTVTALFLSKRGLC